MEMEASPPVVAKKLRNIVRTVFFMLKTGISKSKLMVDLHFMLKKGKYNACKAISNFVLFHHKVHDHLSFLSCRSSNDVHRSFISPREYEFSCSNSPAFYPFYKRSRHHFGKSTNYRYDDVTTIAAVQKVLEMLNNEAAAAVVEATTTSPMVLPGFGKSPMVVKQLRVTDSPFPLKDDCSDSHVDKAAEEFINKFYKELRLQKRSMSMSAFESPAHNPWVRQ